MIIAKFQKHRFSVLGLLVLLFYITPAFLNQFFNHDSVIGFFLTLISLAVVNLVQRYRNKIYFSIVSLLTPLLIFEFKYIDIHWFDHELITFGTFMVYFGVVSYHLFSQMRRIEVFDTQVVFGSITGYLLLGTLIFFMFCFIERCVPGSFTNTSEAFQNHPDVDSLFELSSKQANLFGDLFYFSFISLTTVGYGDIIPLSVWAKKGVVLASIIGPFYLSIVVAITVSKFLAHQKGNEL